MRRALLLVIVGGVPVLFVRGLTDPFGIPKLTLLLAGVAVVLAVRMIEMSAGRKGPGLERMAFPALAMAVPLTLAWLASPYREWALFGQYQRWGGLLPYLLVILVGVLVADAFEDRVEWLMWALVLSGALVALYGLIQIVGLDPLVWIRNGRVSTDASSSLGNPNLTAGFLAMALPAALGFFVFERRNGRPIMEAGLLIVVIAVGLLATRGRGGMAAGAAGSLLTVALLWRPRFRLASVAGWAAVLITGTAVVGAVLLPLTPLSQRYEIADTGRGYEWEAALEMAQTSPLLGRGPSSFAVEGTRYRSPEGALAEQGVHADDPHSLPLNVLTGTGLLGLVGLFLVIGWVVRKSATQPLQNNLVPAFAGVAAAYLIQGLVTVEEVSIRAWFWTALGALALASAQKQPQDRPVNHRPPAIASTAFVVAGLILILVGGWAAFRTLGADRLVYRGLVAFSTDDVPAAEESFDRALRLRPDHRYRRLYGLELADAAIGEGFQDPEYARTLLARARDVMAYLEDFPEATSLLDFARRLEQTQTFDASSSTTAIELYQLAVESDPFNPEARVSLCDLLIRARRYEDALASVEPLTELEVARSRHAYRDVWGAVALARAHLGDASGARLAIRYAEDNWRSRAARVLLSESRG